MAKEDYSYSPIGCNKQRTCLEKILFLTLTISLVVIITLVVLMSRSEKTPNVKEICLSKECAEIAARVTSSIDYSVNPCDNFYDFACGMWIKKHVVPDDRPNLYTHGEVHEEVMVTVKYLLEDSVEEHVDSIRKARDFYEACMNQTEIELVNISVMISLVEEFGGLPMLENSPGGRWNESSFNFMDDVIKTQRLMNAPLINIYVGPDDKNSGTRIIQIDEPPLSMRANTNIHHGPVYNALRDAFVFYGVSIATFLGADPRVAERDLYDIYDLHGVINNISKTNVEKRNMSTRYNKMTIAQLEANYNHAGNTTNNTQFQFNWMTFIQSVLNIAEENITLDESENIVLNSKTYYSNIFKVISQYSPRTIKNYIVWIAIAPMFNKLPGRFLHEFTVYQNFITGTNSQLPRWKKCSKETMAAFSMAVGRLFVKERFDEVAKQEALEMIHEIREAFYARLDELDWMDPSTRGVAKDKTFGQGSRFTKPLTTKIIAKHIIEKIGYPDYILDDTELNKIYEIFDVSRDEYFTNTLNIMKQVRKSSLQHLRDRYKPSTTRADVPPAIVNAYYTPHLNLISFPAGILQPPYYSKYQPRSMNFGSIGWLIGHEIIHGFDNLGRRFDKNGNMVQWWSNEAIRKFTNKTKCIIEQYNGYKVGRAGININGVLTLGENIADNGGLVLSYRAYESWLRHHKEIKSGLPGLNYTHKQLFFINFAQGWCGVSTEQYAMKQLYIDSHSPVRYRIIGSLQNSEDFSRVFECPVGSYMNPAKKCHVW